jgi:hypothetical protein
VRLGVATTVRLRALEPVRRATRVLLGVRAGTRETLRADDGAPWAGLAVGDDDAVAAPLEGALGAAGACPSPPVVTGTLVVGGGVDAVTGSGGTDGSSGTLAAGTVSPAVAARGTLTDSACGTLALGSAAAELEGEIACPDA